MSLRMLQQISAAQSPHIDRPWAGSPTPSVIIRFPSTIFSGRNILDIEKI